MKSSYSGSNWLPSIQLSCQLPKSFKMKHYGIIYNEQIQRYKPNNELTHEKIPKIKKSVFRDIGKTEKIFCWLFLSKTWRIFDKKSLKLDKARILHFAHYIFYLFKKNKKNSFIFLFVDNNFSFKKKSIPLSKHEKIR